MSVTPGMASLTPAVRRVLSRTLYDFASPEGRNLLSRSDPLADWVDDASTFGLFQFLRHHRGSPGAKADVEAWGGHRYQGINLASQDYLGLATHPTVVQAAVEACLRDGTHSAGSEPMGGGLQAARQLESALSDFLGHRHVVLFPTGWAAGYGSIKALVRPYDHVLIDALAHDCLRHGATASTSHVSTFAHNDMASLARRLSRIRAASPGAAILVVTESLFSMDSDHPDFGDFIDTCRRHDATTLVDVAHDLGCLGPGGAGLLAEQGLLGEVDLVMGSFSKSFASVGGFCATNARGAAYAVRGFSGSYTFSNYLPPAQVAAIASSLAIIRSEEGEALRRDMLARASTMRSALAAEGMQVHGRLSPIVLPQIGLEPIARLAYRQCLERGVIVNCVEYPGCRRGQARFRLQLSPRHDPSALEQAALVIADAVRRAVVEYDPIGAGGVGGQ